LLIIDCELRTTQKIYEWKWALLLTLEDGELWEVKEQLDLYERGCPAHKKYSLKS
jgi:hypothetical protein